MKTKIAWTVILIVLIVALCSMCTGGGNSSETTRQTDPKMIDAEIYNYYVQAEYHYGEIIKLMETGSAVDIYNQCEKSKEYLYLYSSTIEDYLKNDTTKEYATEVDNYMSMVYGLIICVEDYLDNQKVETLSKIETNIMIIETSPYVIKEKRVAYLQSSGFTDTEIEEIISKEY